MTGIVFYRHLMMKAYLIFISVMLFVQCKHLDKTASTASLENTYWRLSEVDGKPIVTPENSKEVHIVLTTEDSTYRLKGYAGCNGIGGNYTRSGSNISFTVVSTKMFCTEGMEVENFLIGALAKTNHFKISGETLSLYHGDTFLTKFESVYFK